MRTRRAILPLLGVPLLLASCGGEGQTSAEPQTAETLTVSGTVSVGISDQNLYVASERFPNTGKPGDPRRYPGDPCQPGRGYTDLRPGASVRISDDGGETLALGTLGEGFLPESTPSTVWLVCRLPFTVEGVPADRTFYGVEVSDRGVVRYSREQLNEPLTLSVG